jgi:hypothetical protein
MSLPVSAHDTALTGNIKVDDLFSLSTSSWDKRIAADLIAEMEIHLADKVATLPEMRRILAVKGYLGLRRRIERDVKGKSGPAALRAMADAMRNYALEHPGQPSEPRRPIARNGDRHSMNFRLLYFACLPKLALTANRLNKHSVCSEA